MHHALLPGVPVMMKLWQPSSILGRWACAEGATQRAAAGGARMHVHEQPTDTVWVVGHQLQV